MKGREFDMHLSRFEKVKEKLIADGKTQLIVTDPISIYYLTGRMIYPGERFLVLYISLNRKPILFINELFPQEEITGIELVWYNDLQDPISILVNYLEQDQFLGIDKVWPAKFLLHLQELQGAAGYYNSSPIIDSVRMIKDEKEQEQMRVSSLINDQVMENVVPLLTQGFTESELDEKVRSIYKHIGCEGVSFDPITAYGKNGADPHHGPDQTIGQYGQSVVVDIGGMKDHYASDMTRTFFLGTVSEKQREVYNIVLEANLRGIAAAKPGNRMSDVDRAARDYIASKGYGAYFTHRTGHSIGLEDHEFGDVSLNNDSIIKPGQCFSVEPGIYLPEDEFGVRIEDLVLITEDGCEVLNHYPKDLTILPFVKNN